MNYEAYEMFIVVIISNHVLSIFTYLAVNRNECDFIGVIDI